MHGSERRLLLSGRSEPCRADNFRCPADQKAYRPQKLRYYIIVVYVIIKQFEVLFYVCINTVGTVLKLRRPNFSPIKGGKLWPIYSPHFNIIYMEIEIWMAEQGGGHALPP